jgi:hypothetical protein
LPKSFTASHQYRYQPSSGLDDFDTATAVIDRRFPGSGWFLVRPVAESQKRFRYVS